MDSIAECLSCPSIAGEKRISPGPFIHEGRYWVVDHAYPCALAGWLVLVLKRHATALHELTREEFAELGELQYRTAQALRGELGSQREYSICLAEGPGFNHIHVHMVPRAQNLPEELRGPRIFALLNPAAHTPLAPEEVVAVSERLRAAFAATELA